MTTKMAARVLMTTLVGWNNHMVDVMELVHVHEMSQPKVVHKANKILNKILARLQHVILVPKLRNHARAA